MKLFHLTRLALILALVGTLGATACGKKADTTSRNPPPAAMPAALHVMGVTLGRTIGPDNRTILSAKTQNMPKDNIEAAIKRASGKDASTIFEMNIEGKAPHGALIFVECATDNNARTVSNIRTCFGRAKGETLNNGALEFMFSRKAVFRFPKPAMDLDELEFALIDAGIESLEEEEGEVSVYGDYTAFGALSVELEKMGITPESAALERIANSPVEFTDEQMVDIDKLIEKLEDDEDVQFVYTNIA